MRKGGPSEIREVACKASTKGKEKKDLKELGYISEEDEVKFVKKLQLDTRRFKGMLPFKCFACGSVGHYATKCPHKDNHDKGKDSAKGNRKQLLIEEVIICMKIVMACLIVMNVNLIKKLNFSWLMKIIILWML